MSAERAKTLGVTPLATIRAQATSGVAPKWIMLAPVTGVQKVLARAGWSLADVDLFELNEAFSVQAMSVVKELGLDLSCASTSTEARLPSAILLAPAERECW